MGDLSKHFSKSEFACKHCGVYLPMDDSLIEGLEIFREVVGKAVTVTSGYRCPNHPIEVKKSKPGEHSRRKAADIKVKGMSQKNMYKIVAQIPQFRNGGIGIYPGKNIIHVDTRGVRARWSYINNVQSSFEEGYKLLK